MPDEAGELHLSRSGQHREETRACFFLFLCAGTIFCTLYLSAVKVRFDCTDALTDKKQE